MLKMQVLPNALIVGSTTEKFSSCGKWKNAINPWLIISYFLCLACLWFCFFGRGKHISYKYDLFKNYVYEVVFLISEISIFYERLNKMLFCLNAES